jgi:hypothetical protein
MNRKTAEVIFAACERALVNLTEAEVAIAHISDSTERAELMRALSRSITDILAGVRASAVVQYPEIQQPELRGEPDTTLNDEEIAAVAKLTIDDVSLIDRALIAECASTWRKIARIVGYALKSLNFEFKDIPLGYLVQRVIALVEAGELVCQGDARYIHNSEVRLPRGADDVVYPSFEWMPNGAPQFKL